MLKPATPAQLHAAVSREMMRRLHRGRYLRIGLLPLPAPGIDLADATHLASRPHQISLTSFDGIGRPR